MTHISLGPQSAPDVKQDDDDEVYDGAHDDEEGSNLESGCGVVVEADGVRACGSALAAGGRG